MTKERLKAYTEIKRELADLQRRLEELEAAMYDPRAQALDGMPRGSSGENYTREEQLDTKDALLAMYEARVAALDDALLSIENAIEKLEPRERQLVRLHYIDGLKWEQVAVEMCYSWRQVHRIHSDALNKLKEGEQNHGESVPV